MVAEKKNINLAIDKDLYKQFKQYCLSNDLTYSAQIEKLIRALLKK